MTADASPNPFLSASTVPYGLPDFTRIKDEHFLPAIESGIAEQLAEIDAIVANPEPATFENTLVALEQSGQQLFRAVVVFYNNSSAHSTEVLQQLEAKIAPMLAEHSDNIYLNAALATRCAQVSAEGLDPESSRLLSEYLKAFRRAGAQLGDESKARLRGINSQISSLTTTYSQRLLRDTNDSALLVDTAAELDGLSSEDVAAAAEAAQQSGHAGKYLLTLILPSAQPPLETLTNRGVRQRLFEASLARGSRDNENNVLGVAAELAALRAERADLLGYASHAEFAMDDQTAPSLSAVRSMLETLAPAAVRNAKVEADQLAAVAGHPIEAWDWAYYSAMVQREKYRVDAVMLREYFELERVLNDGVFYAAHKLYGLTFEPREDLIGYHPDVRIWEVKNADGTGLGLFLGDYFTRDEKNGGAWMNPLVEQSTLLGHQSVVVNNLNISKPAPGEPALLTPDQVRTCFHEFGHALHGLFSNVTFPRFSGTSVARDFVEYPSQVNEMWILDPEVVGNYARHYQTGAPLDATVVERMKDASLWGEGFGTTEYLGAALLDLAWHELSPGQQISDPLAFERDALAAAGLAVEQIPPRYRTGYFKHIFAGGYAAGYYSYIWSEVLDADTVEWFKENGGLIRANADQFRAMLLSRGNAADPLDSFRSFRGRDAALEPLLNRRGLN